MPSRYVAVYSARRPRARTSNIPPRHAITNTYQMENFRVASSFIMPRMLLAAAMSFNNSQEEVKGCIDIFFKLFVTAVQLSGHSKALANDLKREMYIESHIMVLSDIQAYCEYTVPIVYLRVQQLQALHIVVLPHDWSPRVRLSYVLGTLPQYSCA